MSLALVVIVVVLAVIAALAALIIWAVRSGRSRTAPPAGPAQPGRPVRPAQPAPYIAPAKANPAPANHAPAASAVAQPGPTAPAARDAAANPAAASAAVPRGANARLVGFGPGTSSLPALTPAMLEAARQRPDGVLNTGTLQVVREGEDVRVVSAEPDVGFGNHAFGFFGAVTSAISIVPQVGRDQRKH